MILIISQDGYETSTDRVIDWLSYYKAKFVRINGDDIFSNKFGYIRLNNTIDDSNIKYSTNFNIGWFRRWSTLKHQQNLSQNTQNTKLALATAKNSRLDEAIIRQYFLSNLKVKKWLTNPHNYDISKIKQLQFAKTVGLTIPDSLITSFKSEVGKLKQEHTSIIMKDIHRTFRYVDSNKSIITTTTRITQKMFEHMPEFFFPTLFQELIKKKYEIRTFYLDGRTFSMAIISQNDTSTSIDFRNYNYSKPNRYIPYKLPKTIEIKLKCLMDKLNLKTGSIDFVIDRKDNFIFLEINPVGQFGMTSYPCNYFLEEKIAKYLIQNDK